MDKVDVNGPGTHPVFNFLKTSTNTRINWNFGAYYLISKTGAVSGYERVHPNTFEVAIRAEL